MLALAMSACAAPQPPPQPAQDGLETLGQCQAAAQDFSSQPLPVRAISPNLFPWTSPENSERIFDALADLKVRFIRFDFIWPNIEPSRGERDFHVYDGFVKQAHQRGIRILALVSFAPGWANGGGPPSQPPRDVADWADFLRALVGRYMPCGDLATQEGWTDGYGIQAWEIWNEPNHPLFWTPPADPAAYTRLLAGSYRAIKALDPRSLVLNGGPTMLPTGGHCYAASCFIEDIYAQGAKNYFDAMSLHPYTGRGGPEGMHSLVGTVRDIMDANGDSDKPIWLTEFSYGSWYRGQPYQADYLEQTYRVELPVAAARNNVKMLFWYSLVDSADEAYGLLRADFGRKDQRKESYFRYRDSIPDE